MNLRFPAAPSGGPRLTKPLLSFAVGLPVMKDNNGFISRVRPDGAVENLKFIEGGHGGGTLNAPKGPAIRGGPVGGAGRSEEHTAELQSQSKLGCRLLLGKKKNKPHEPAIEPM